VCSEVNAEAEEGVVMMGSRCSLHERKCSEETLSDRWLGVWMDWNTFKPESSSDGPVLVH
jgi:hypothetical protein